MSLNVLCQLKDSNIAKKVMQDSKVIENIKKKENQEQINKRIKTNRYHNYQVKGNRGQL